MYRYSVLVQSYLYLADDSECVHVHVHVPACCTYEYRYNHIALYSVHYRNPIQPYCTYNLQVYRGTAVPVVSSRHKHIVLIPTSMVPVPPVLGSS
jgi:hypothetical protein